MRDPLRLAINYLHTTVGTNLKRTLQSGTLRGRPEDQRFEHHNLSIAKSHADGKASAFTCDNVDVEAPIAKRTESTQLTIHLVQIAGIS